MSASPAVPLAASARTNPSSSARHGSGRSVAGRLWMAMLAGSALMFGAVPSLAEADEPAPVVERTRPAERSESSGGSREVVSAAAEARAPVEIREAQPSSAVGASAAVNVSASDDAGRIHRTAQGMRSATKAAQKPASRASAGRASSRTAVGAQRSKRPVRPATRSGLRKIADASRESPSVRLTRAERGVVQHIARKYRVNASSVEQYMGYARQSGKTYNVDPYLIMAVMATESSFNPRAQSRVGAQGLMQVHTRMHKKRFKPYGSTDTVWEPKVNIQVGSSILSDYLKRYGGSERRALKAYVGAARMSHDGGYGNKVLRRRDEFVSVSVAASNNATSQAMASQADGGRKSVDL
ncbi:lytic transglycosylase domain-containing protein [Lautropia mirabilis]|uniref:lytic transglycosylase domain-containing protein n=1 Tax=Lautropia mirabilis TaxID=47671 RepID=UPI00234B6AD0|nr:lytic transglycosylase domain-containing protein [Lautropia mirabilis]MDC6092726.1 lytic transglycosylase domain-containing protein [Lautropia mirabilis]